MRHGHSTRAAPEPFPLWIVLALACALRLIRLGRSELWFDEAYSALLSLEPVRRIFQELSHDSSPPLYYIVLRAWRIVFGHADVTLRALSVVAGVATIYVVDELGREVWNAAVGRWAALLLTITPLHVYYSQEARPYGLFVFFSACSLLAFERIRRHSSSWGWMTLFVVSTTIALYTHNYGVFLLMPLMLAVASGRVPVLPAAASVVSIAVLYAFWLPILWQQVRAGTTEWVIRIWHATPPLLALVVSFKAFVIGGSAPAYVPITGFPVPVWVHFAAYATAAALAGIALRRSAPKAIESQHAAVMIAVLLGTPWLLSFALPIYVASRYDVIALPYFVLVVAAGLAHVEGRLTVAALIFAVGAASLGSYYVRPPLTGARGQAALLVSSEGPHDAVVAVGFTRNSLEYYARVAGVHAPFYSFPRSLGEHRGWLDERELEDPAVLERQAAATAFELSQHLHASDRLWVVHSGLLGPATAALVRQLYQVFAPVPCPAKAETLGMSCWVGRQALRFDDRSS